MRPSTRARRLLEMQGYLGHDDATLCGIAPWTRLAPALCLIWTAIGTALGSAPALWALAVIAGAGALLPYHPFDLVHNLFLRRLTGARALPRHGVPRRFACSLATIWLLAAGTAFALGAELAGRLLGASLVATAAVPVATGFCVPSYLWLRLLRLRRRPGLDGASGRSLAILLLLTAGAADAEAPRPVSPGAASEVAPVASRCPAFTWTLIPEATGYEIAVYASEDGPELGPTDGGPLLHERLPAGAGSWTPPADECLAAGTSFAWSVRAETASGSTEWSLPALFEVVDPTGDLVKDELVRVVLERLGYGAGSPRSAGATAAEAAWLEPRLSEDPRPEGMQPFEARALARSAGPKAVASLPELAGPVAQEPPVQLAVDGAVRAQDFRFEGVRTVTILLGAAAFRINPTSESDTWAVDGEGLGRISQAPDGFASVDLITAVPRLPVGATIESFSCLWLDGSSADDANFRFDLRRRVAWGESSVAVAVSSGPTVGSDPNVVFGTPAPTILEPVVPDLPQEYFIEGFWAPVTLGSFSFAGCQLVLLVDGLAP